MGVPLTEPVTDTLNTSREREVGQNEYLHGLENQVANKATPTEWRETEKVAMGRRAISENHGIPFFHCPRLTLLLL